MFAVIAATACRAFDPRTLFPEPEKLAEMAMRLARTLVVAFLAPRLLFLLVGRLERVIRRAGEDPGPALQRARTVGLVLRNFVTVVLGAGVLIHALGIFGRDVRPVLAGAGILGVALGVGARTLVRDVIAGVFILAGDPFGVGDLIEVPPTSATVEAITLGVTTLRDFNGDRHFAPNGELRTVTNRSRGWQRLAVDVPVASGADLEDALQPCRRVAEGMNADPAWRARLLDPVDVWGIESLDPTESTIRIVRRARPGPDAPEASRELRRRVHDALAAAGHRFSAGREPLIPARPAGPRP